MQYLFTLWCIYVMLAQSLKYTANLGIIISLI